MQITIIIATFNAVQTLQECISSVVNQTYANKQLIIIDGGSKDATVDIIQANLAHINYWISEPDKGIYNAWNKGLKQVKGDWVYFIGADDYFWDVNALSKMADALMLVDSNTQIAYAQIMLINEQENTQSLVGKPWQEVKNQFKQVMTIPHQGVMHRSSLFEKNGMFDESFKIAGDYELLLRELKDHDALFVPNVTLAGMRTGGISTNLKNSLLSMKEVRRAQRKHGISFPGKLWIITMTKIRLRFVMLQIFGETTTKKIIALAKSI